MEREWREYFIAWSRTEEYGRKVEEAKRIIREALSRFEKPYIAYSGGKDSTALMHLVLREDENVTVVHWDYGRYYIPRNLHEEIVDIAKKCGAKNILILTSPLYEKLGRRARNVIGRHFIGLEIPKLIKQGYDCAFLGLRAEESVKRRIRTENFYERDPRGIVNVFPLRNFTWRDVWAYIVSNDVPYLRSFYDKYCRLLGYDKARFVTLFDPEFDVFGATNVDKFLMWKYYVPDHSK